MRLFGRQSVTFRLTALFAAVSTAVLLLLGLMIGSLVEKHFEELDMDLLGGKLDLIRHAVSIARTADDLASIAGRLDGALVGHHGLGVSIWDPAGKPVYGYGNSDFPASLRSNARRNVAQSVSWQGEDGRSFRGIAGDAKPGIPGSAPLFVMVSTDLSHHQHFMRSFRITLWSVVGFASVVSGLLGWAVARKGLAPLHKIARDAAGITATRLDRRLSEQAIPVELAEVARTLNEMLGRLEDSFQRLSDFSSDLAHELRTPVSNLITQTQVTLSKVRTAEEYQNILVSNAEEYERLSRMIGDMLFLAKADNDLMVPNLEQVDLRAEAVGILDYYEAVAAESGIALSVSGEGAVSGDKLMLRRALGNLVSNAFQHTPKGGGISIRIGHDGAGRTTCSVINTGETIPEEHLPRLFDRFYRADPSRQRLTEGTGLGLAITRSIVHAHGGNASVESSNGITTFSLSLPT